MIPLTNECRYEYVHPETKVIYLLRYVTDAERTEFQNEAKRVQACSAALSRLQKTISKLSKDDQEDLPQEIQDEIQKANDQLYEHQKWTVDFFVTGWKHQTLELPELQGKPSSYFKINEIPELATAIQRLYPILTGIKTDEAKN